MWLKDPESNLIFYTSGVLTSETEYYDHDDELPQMYLFPLTDWDCFPVRCYTRGFNGDDVCFFGDYYKVSDREVREYLTKTLDKYFTEHISKKGDYSFLDPRLEDGKIVYHLENEKFRQGGQGEYIYGTPEDREKCIKQEIRYIMHERFRQ